MNYLGIGRAALEIAYDNGGINRYRPQEEAESELDDFLADYHYPDRLEAIDGWLLGLSDEDLGTVCCGEHDDMGLLMALRSAPLGADDLLNEVFDWVC